MFISLYRSKGPWDILNRGNILKLCQNVPLLGVVSTNDLESISFAPSKEAPDGEASQVELRDPTLGRRLLGEKGTFLEWGVHVKEIIPLRYPHILNKMCLVKPNAAGVGNLGLLKEARGRDFLSERRKNTVIPDWPPTLATVTVQGINRKVVIVEEHPPQQDWAWISATLNSAREQGT